MMSWELASFLILGAVLLGGFAWYERSRPPSQVVALVAALAALAIAGRIAFAAFPNVKPTTDIVIFAGYALGAAPGFAVGALAALVSNFWFGQGPWTPWQMAGWGLCGVLGAALAAVGGRNVGRLTLAAVCGFAGIAYGALLNFSLMATYGGDLSLERFLVLESRAVPFDAAHAIGNVAFALIAGPAMIRMLARFRERFEWRDAGRRGRGAGLRRCVLACSSPWSRSPARRPGRRHRPGRRAGWSRCRTPTAASAPRPGDDSSASTTGLGDARARGRRPQPARRRQPRQDPGRLPARQRRRTGQRRRLRADDPRPRGRRRRPALLRRPRPRRGAAQAPPRTAPTKAGRARTAFAVIALRAAGADGGLDRVAVLAGRRPERRRRLGRRARRAEQRRRDRRGDAGDARARRPPSSGLAYLRKHQRPNGGFALGGSGGVNSQSTAWAVQGMIAVGADPARSARAAAAPSTTSPRRQAADGHYRYSASSDQTPVWVTGQVLVAVAGDLPGRAAAASPPTTVATSAAAVPAPVPGRSPPPRNAADHGACAYLLQPVAAVRPPCASSRHAGPLVPNRCPRRRRRPRRAAEPSRGLPADRPASQPVEASEDDAAVAMAPVGIGLAAAGSPSASPGWARAW